MSDDDETADATSCECWYCPREATVKGLETGGMLVHLCDQCDADLRRGDELQARYDRRQDCDE